jgi:hypothetical protein
MKIRTVGAKSFDADEHTDGLTDGRTDGHRDRQTQKLHTVCIDRKTV